MAKPLKISTGMPQLDEARKERIDAFAEYVSILPWFNIDVLHKFYKNIFQLEFKQTVAVEETEEIENNALDSFEIRAITCADFLHSPVIKRIDYNAFKIENEIRDQLRAELHKREKTLLKKIGEFMIAYSEECRQHFLGFRYREAYRIEGRLVVDPQSAAGQISNHIISQLNQNRTAPSKSNMVGFYLNVLNGNLEGEDSEIVKLLNGYNEILTGDKSAGIEALGKLKAKENAEETITVKLPVSVREQVLEQIKKNNKQRQTTTKSKPQHIPKYLWCLDNGHGKLTKGKRSPKTEDGRQLLEYEFNRDIVERIKKRLDEIGVKYFDVVPDFDHVDNFLEKRVERANNFESDLPKIYISVHCNASSTGTGKGEWTGARGIETYFNRGSDKSKEIAMIFQKSLIEQTGFKDRGAKGANFSVLKNTKMPAILTENGFYNNREEFELLMKDEVRQQIAEGHVQGILEMERVGVVEEKGFEIYLSGEEFNKEKFLELSIASKSEKLIFVDEPRDLKYELLAEEKRWLIYNRINKKLIHGSAETHSSQAGKYILKKLEAIAKWEEFIELDNPKSKLERDKLEVRFIVDGKEVESKNGIIELEFSGEDLFYEIHARNLSDKDLYFSLTNLSPQFGIQNVFQCQPIPPNEEWTVLDAEHGLTIKNEKEKTIEDYFKVIVSDRQFDDYRFNQEDIAIGTVGYPELTRSVYSNVGFKEVLNSDWAAHTIRTRLTRKFPFYTKEEIFEIVNKEIQNDEQTRGTY